MSDVSPNSDASNRQPTENARRRVPSFLVSQIALAVAGLVIVLVGFRQLTRDREPVDGASERQAAREPVVDQRPETREEVAFARTPATPATPADYAKDVERALGKSRLIVVNGQLSRTQSDLQHLQQTLEDWHNATTGLLSNTESSRLAADQRMVERYVTLMEMPRPTTGDVDSLSQQLDVLSTPASRLTPATPPTDEFAAAVERLHGEVHTALETLQSHQDQLRKLIDDAPSETTSAVSLQTALDTLRAEQATDVRRRLLTRPWSSGSQPSRREASVTP